MAKAAVPPLKTAKGTGRRVRMPVAAGVSGRAQPINANTVRTLLVVGLPLAKVARAIGMDEPTLKARAKTDPVLRAAIEGAADLGEAQIAQSLHRMATTGNNPTVAIYLGKVRLGWIEGAQATGPATNWLVEGRPRAETPEAWAADYGPMRAANTAAKTDKERT